ncbi:SLAM family member 5-like isoform X2 [Cololabis saira]|uniref:SLAM family member 5-like isoform X2 n=1 Tax=Cololabis saira TaxID=129043 RepID=UPI002AD2CCFC|nr:SLAM family member 5-like isoform X2 [Cololabis saira]
MTAVVFLLVVSLLDLVKGAEHVFLEQGTDLHLHVKKHIQLDKQTDFQWKHNNSRIVKYFKDIKPILYEPYKASDVLVFDNYTLLLKNVKHNNSGNYDAVLSGKTDTIVVKYKVTVQDPVSPAELTVESVLDSSTSCNLTMTCSTRPSNISSTVRCDTETCSQEGGEQLLITKHGDSLLVYLSNESVICNHSNHVSWLNDTRNIKHLCPLVGVSKRPTSIAIRAAVTLALLLLAVVFTIYILRKRKRGRSNSPN